MIIVQENIKRGINALKTVLINKTTVHRAMYRNGLGWIDFVWGDEGKKPTSKGKRKGEKGISHIIEARQRKDKLTYNQAIDLLQKMVLVIALGQESKPTVNFGNSKNITLDYQGIILHLIQNKGSNAWVLTVYEAFVSEGVALDAVYDAIKPTQNKPTPYRLAMVAPSLDSDDSELSLTQSMHSDSNMRGGTARAEVHNSIPNVNLKRNAMKTEPIFTKFKHNAQGAIKLLMQQKKGIAIGALHHPSVGDIDLIWGKEGTGKSDGFGLAKLVKFHPEVLDNLQELLSAMIVKQKNKNRVILESKDHKAAISLNWFEQERKWLLSAYSKESQSAITTIHTDGVEQDDSLTDRLYGSINELDNYINGGHTMKTELIKYNLKERGRKHRGQERNFDIPRIAATINSRETQERVKNRDMLGYYGHWSRIKFGMNPQEGKIDSGQVIHVEPAIVTTHLKAFPDGTIEHQAEFLPTKSGELAAKLFAGKAGGFSSAIDTLKPEFHGFDYVLEPNYTTNRGYTFDSVCEGGLCGALTLDEVETAVYEEQMAGMMRLVNGFDEFKQFAMDAIDSLQKENKAEQEKNAFRYVKPKMIPIKKFKPEPKFITDESHKNAILDSANRFRDDLSVDRFAAGLMVENMIKNKAPKPSQQDVFLNGLIKGFTKQ